MADTFRVEGLREIEAKLRALPQKIAKRGVRGGLLAAGKVIRDEGRQRAPVDTGLLKSQIIYYPARASAHQYADQVRVGVKNRKKKKGDTAKGKLAYYWKFVELGSSKMAARPFLRPALVAKGREAAQRAKERMRERIEQLAKESA